MLVDGILELIMLMFTFIYICSRRIRHELKELLASLNISEITIKLKYIIIIKLYNR